MEKSRLSTPRRPHRKSRRGCMECKRRHIKCDETRPRCINCKTITLNCSFSNEQQLVADSVTEAPASSISTPNHIIESPSSSSNQNDSVLPINMEHLEFLHHFCTSTCKTFTWGEDSSHVWNTTIFQYAQSYPFLMYEILAVAAQHLGHCKPDRLKHYQTKSMELQTEALKGFNAIQKVVNEANCGAILIFQALLSMHVLADKPSNQTEPGEYFEHILRCIKLMRSVHTVVVAKWWSYLKESDLAPILKPGPQPKPWNIPPECEKLWSLMENDTIDDQSKENYNAAIDRLHWALGASHASDQKYTMTRWLIAWPVVLKDEFIELLTQHQPEALVIISHYAVLMHFHRHNWMVGDAGTLLLKAINVHLKGELRTWLAWPFEVMAINQDLDT